MRLLSSSVLTTRRATSIISIRIIRRRLTIVVHGRRIVRWGTSSLIRRSRTHVIRHGYRLYHRHATATTATSSHRLLIRCRSGIRNVAVCRLWRISWILRRRRSVRRRSLVVTRTSVWLWWVLLLSVVSGCGDDRYGWGVSRGCPGVVRLVRCWRCGHVSVSSSFTAAAAATAAGTHHRHQTFPEAARCTKFEPVDHTAPVTIKHGPYRVNGIPEDMRVGSVSVAGECVLQSHNDLLAFERAVAITIEVVEPLG